MAAALPFIGPAIQGVQAISSGVSGKQGQQQLNQQMNTTNQAYQGMLGQGQQVLDNLRGQGEQFANPGLARNVLNQAQGLGGILTGNAQTAAGQIGQGGGAALAQGALGNRFDFQPVQQNLQQSLNLARDAGNRARAGASDQAALAMRQGETQLDSALAARGLSRNSGAGAVGMAQLIQGNSMGRAQLERDLANQAGQMGLQGAQLDTANQLQMAGMGSQYNLGMNQLGAQTGLGLQQLNDQQAMQRAGLLNDAALGGFNALQSTYQQNYLAPQLQNNSMMAGLGGQLAGIGAGGMQGNTNLMAKGVETAGSGKGAALGGLGSSLPGALGGLASSIGGKGGPNLNTTVNPGPVYGQGQFWGDNIAGSRGF